MESGRRGILLTLLALAAVAVLAVLVSDPFEPRHRGIRASDFVFRVVATNRFSSADVEAQLKPMGAALAVPSLVKVAEREDSLWRRWYQLAFNRAPFALRKHLPAPKSNRLAVMNAVVALGTFGPEAAPAVPALTEIHDRCEEFLKSAVVNALGRVGPDARSAIPSLVSGLAPTNQSYLRATVITCLARIDPAGAESYAALEPLLRDSDESVAFATVGAFAVMTQRSPSLISNVWTGLADSRLMVSLRAGSELGKLGALTRESMDPFLRGLDSPLALERIRAATILGLGGKFAPAVVPALLRAADDPETKVRDAVLASLSALAWQSSVVTTCRVDAAREVMRRGTENQSWLIMNIAPQLQPETAKLIPLITSALRHESSRVRGKAAETLGKLGADARNAAPELRELTHDDWLNVREAATNALRRIGE